MIDALVFQEKLELLLCHYSQLTGREIELLPDVIEMWFEELNDRNLTTDQFTQAVRRCILANRWFPTLEELIKLVADDEADIYDQWLLVTQGMRRYSPGFNWGQYQEFVELVGLDPVAAHVVEVMGSYRSLSETPAKDLSFRRDEFVRLYKVYKKREQEICDRALEAQPQRLLAQETQPQLALPETSSEMVDFQAQFATQFASFVGGTSLKSKVEIELDPVERERQRLEAMARNKELAKLYLEQAALSSPRSSVIEEPES